MCPCTESNNDVNSQQQKQADWKMDVQNNALYSDKSSHVSREYLTSCDSVISFIKHAFIFLSSAQLYTVFSDKLHWHSPRG